MNELQQKREEKVLEKLIDAQFKLFDELIEKDEDDLTEAESNYVDAMYEWLDVLEEMDDEDNDQE